MYHVQELDKAITTGGMAMNCDSPFSHEPPVPCRTMMSTVPQDWQCGLTFGSEPFFFFIFAFGFGRLHR